MAKTKIEWVQNPDGTPGESWNPLRGTQGTWHCTKVSPECTNCYAERLNMSDRHHNGPAYRAGADMMRLDERVLLQPLSWRKPRVCFVCSMTDLFHEQVPFEWIDRIMNVCRQAPQSFFLVLTKRIERAVEYQDRIDSWPDNVGVGVSIGTDHYAKLRIPELLKLEVRLRSLSIEPLLDYVDLRPWFDQCSDRCDHSQTFSPDRGHRPAPSGIGWVKVGGETGARARPMDIDHVRPIRDICIATNTPFFFKQWGEWTCESPGRGWWGDSQWIGGVHNPHQAYKVGRIKAGRMLDGRFWNEFPRQLEGRIEHPLHGRMAEGPADRADRGAPGRLASEEFQVSPGPGSSAQGQLFGS